MDRFTYTDAPPATAFAFAKAGIPLIVGLGFATLVFALLGLAFFAVLFLAATAFTAYFFRDPERLTPEEENAVVSPADGRVVYAARVEDSRYTQGPRLKVSIFMSVFNVHVNRNPVSGTVTRVDYNPGKFLRADLDKASKVNEQNAVTVETRDGAELCVVQVAGLVARRILCGLRPGNEVRQGERYGMIRFGSRLDVYLPENARIAVRPGDRVRAGTTVIGYLK